MKLATNLIAIALGVSSFVLGGCSSPEGTYTLDKVEMKKAVEGETADVPQGQQEFVRELLLKMVDAMNVSLELKSGGKMAMTASLGDEEKKTVEGTWKSEGSGLTFELEGEVTKCVKNDSKKLTCAKDKSEKGGPPMVFVKS